MFFTRLFHSVVEAAGTAELELAERRKKAKRRKKKQRKDGFEEDWACKAVF